MATNRDLLKEAIADAKAVKETAIANAKAALEEAFTPFLKEKLASKIAEMDEVDEELELEESEVSEVEKEKASMKKESDDMTEEISLDELLAELEAESSMEEAETTDETYMDEDVYEAKGEEEEMNIEDMSEDDLKSFIEDVIKDMVAAGELEAGESVEGEEGEMGDEIDMEAGAEEEVDEEINIDELLAEISKETKDVKETEELEEFNPAQRAGAEVSGDNPAIKAVANFLDISFDEAAKVLNKLKSGAKAIGKDISQAAANIGGAAMSGKGTRYESELEEAYQTVEALKAELNEINLLNAKLLYTNKIFRNKSLTETQKVNVLTAFDKATTKKEVELVYNTLTESLKVSTTKAPIKESLGSASKVLGGATSKPIIENDAFARMRELAFGNKK